MELIIIFLQFQVFFKTFDYWKVLPFRICGLLTNHFYVCLVQYRKMTLNSAKHIFFSLQSQSRFLLYRMSLIKSPYTWIKIIAKNPHDVLGNLSTFFRKIEHYYNPVYMAKCCFLSFKVVFIVQQETYIFILYLTFSNYVVCYIMCMLWQQ